MIKYRKRSIYSGRNPEEKELLAKYLLQRILDREAAEAGSSVLIIIIITITFVVIIFIIIVTTNIIIIDTEGCLP